MDINLIMHNLGENKIIFDDKLSLINGLERQITSIYPSASINNNYSHIESQLPKIDLLVELNGSVFLIQASYKKFGTEFDVNGIHYKFKNHSANDHGRYDHLKDIASLEKARLLLPSFQAGYVLMLTNDHKYWEEPRKKYSIDTEFKIHEDTVKTGKMNWTGAGIGSMVGRNSSIILTDSYTMHWRNYCNVHSGRGGQFRYLLNSINAS